MLAKRLTPILNGSSIQQSCGGLFCQAHLVRRKEVATCSACELQRLARESASNITDSDEQQLVSLLTQDMVSTIGPGFEYFVVESAARHRLFIDDVLEYRQRVIDDVQQRFHDEFVDTTWPTCPRHPTHPLWFTGGWWRCAQTGEPIATLGALPSHKRQSG